MKKRYLIYFTIILTFLILLIFYKKSNNKELESSIIYNKILNYSITKNLEELSIDKNFQENSTEDYFFRGLKSYYNNDFLQAKELLRHAELKNSKDSILKLYLNFFINNCIYKLSGSGDLQRVRYIIDSIDKYPILANDVNFIWENFSTILSTKKDRETSIYLLEKYIKDSDNATPANKLKLKGYVAIFKMMNKNYAESIYLFYDIISESENIKDINLRNSIKIKAYEYIGNMHFILHDYETAIEKYNLAIDIPMKDQYENASSKYGAYTNRTASYIQLKKYSTAREYSKKTLEIIPFLPDQIVDGVKIFIYNNLVRIELYQNNLEKAKEYLNLCDELLNQNRNKGILNNDVFVELSYCELYIEEKNYPLVEKLLEEISIKNSINQLGFESEIYSLQMELYEKTKEFDKYSIAHEKLIHVNREFDSQVKKDYLKFIEKSFIADQLKEQEKISNLKIRLLIYSILIITAFIFFQITRISRLKKNNFIDQLTNVYNRKYLNKILENLDKKNSKPIEIGVLMLDIDYFKKYNDNYGHIQGDYVIKSVAEILNSSIERGDCVIRYGGEEFLIILKNRNSLDLENIYMKIFKRLEEKNIPHKFSLVSDHVTLSVGGAKNIVKNSTDLSNLINDADSSLYQSKESGRDRFTLFENHN